MKIWTTMEIKPTTEQLTCPICGKGKMMPGTRGWCCNHFQPDGEKCGFTIFRTYNGYNLTDQDLTELVTRGATSLHQFISRDGVPYSATIRIAGTQVRVFNESNIQVIPCPHCGGRIRKTTKGYICEHYFVKGDKHCAFYLPHEVHGRPITADEAEELFEHGRTEVLDGFIHEGKAYSSCLVVASDGTVMVDGRICRCPKCGGIVYAGIKGYNCSNFRNPAIRCNFVVWREMGRRKITVCNVRELCTQGQTREMVFHTLSGDEYEKALCLDSDFNVKMK